MRLGDRPLRTAFRCLSPPAGLTYREIILSNDSTTLPEISNSFEKRSSNTSTVQPAWKLANFQMGARFDYSLFEIFNRDMKPFIKDFEALAFGRLVTIPIGTNAYINLFRNEVVIDLYLSLVITP